MSTSGLRGCLRRHRLRVDQKHPPTEVFRSFGKFVACKIWVGLKLGDGPLDGDFNGKIMIELIMGI